jgi:hypothetical protein
MSLIFLHIGHICKCLVLIRKIQMYQVIGNPLHYGFKLVLPITNLFFVISCSFILPSSSPYLIQMSLLPQSPFWLLIPSNTSYHSFLFFFIILCFFLFIHIFICRYIFWVISPPWPQAPPSSPSFLLIAEHILYQSTFKKEREIHFISSASCVQFQVGIFIFIFIPPHVSSSFDFHLVDE